MSKEIDEKIAKFKKGVQKLEEKKKLGTFTPKKESELKLLKIQLNKYSSEAETIKQLTNNSSINNLNNNTSILN